MGLAAIALIIIAGWQIVACEVANYELREDLRDIAAQNGIRIGLNGPQRDDDIRGFVIGRAKEHTIQLEPAQVKVQRTGTAQAQGLNLAVDYDQAAGLLIHHAFHRRCARQTDSTGARWALTLLGRFVIQLVSERGARDRQGSPRSGVGGSERSNPKVI